MKSLFLQSQIFNISFILDLIFGDPHYRLHPVRLIGRLIELLYRNISLENKKTKGAAIVVFSVVICLIIYFFIKKISGKLWIFWDIYLCYSFIALKDLFDHINPLKEALEKEDLDEARRLISRVVGRDPERLDREGIIRAAVETISENFVDGFLSPLFWFSVGCIFGYPVAFMLFYKVVNTLDSMLGYKTEELKEVGYFSAKLDDIMNFIPARISLFIFFTVALFLRLDAKRALSVALRDRLKHESPNSGHPEAFFAGLLGIRLGGPTYYPYGLVKKGFLGDERRRPSVSDISFSLRFSGYSAIFSVLLLNLWAALL